MFLAELPALLRRRWPLLVLGIAFSLAMGAVAVRVVPLSYSASAEVLLLPPDSVVGAEGNPYLALGGLGPAGDVLAKALTDSSSQDQFGAAGMRGTYNVGPDPASAAPLIAISVEESSPAATLRSLELVLARLPVELRELQLDSGVTSDALISASVVTQDNTVETIRKPLIRALLVAIAGGAAGTLLSIALVDSWLLRRRQRRRMEHRADDVNKGSGAGAAAPGVARAQREQPGQDVVGEPHTAPGLTR